MACGWCVEGGGAVAGAEEESSQMAAIEILFIEQTARDNGLCTSQVGHLAFDWNRIRCESRDEQTF